MSTKRGQRWYWVWMLLLLLVAGYASASIVSLWLGIWFPSPAATSYDDIESVPVVRYKKNIRARTILRSVNLHDPENKPVVGQRILKHRGVATSQPSKHRSPLVPSTRIFRNHACQLLRRTAKKRDVFVLQRKALQYCLENPMGHCWSSSARIMPNYMDGKAAGLRFVWVRKKSWYSLLQLRSGDILVRFNGELLGVDNLGYFYQALGGSIMTFCLTLLRKGKIRVLHFDVKP